MFVAGQRSWATSGASFEAIDPATGERFATVALGDKADIDAAVASARTAFEGGWAGLPPVRRVRILNQLASLLRERRAEFAALESLDVGKPLRQADDDVSAAAGYFEFFAGVADTVFGSSVPLGQGFLGCTLREPPVIRDAPTGLAIRQAAADPVVPVTLELGGKSPNIIFGDADLERAAASSATTLMQNAAQTCTAPTRLLLERSAHDRFVDLLAQRIRTIRMGPGLDNPDMGPVVSERQMNRVLGYLDAGARDGATAVTGGGRSTARELAHGYF